MAAVAAPINNLQLNIYDQQCQQQSGAQAAPGIIAKKTPKHPRRAKKRKLSLAPHVINELFLNLCSLWTCYSYIVFAYVLSVARRSALDLFKNR